MVFATALPLQPFLTTRWHMRLSGRILQRGIHDQRVDWLQGSFLLLPRVVFVEIGGFDEGYFMYSEEVDLQRRLNDVGVSTWLIPSITVMHSGGASSEGIDIGEQMMDSRHLYARKFGGQTSLRWALGGTALFNLFCRLTLRVVGRHSSPRQAFRREWRRAIEPSGHR